MEISHEKSKERVLQAAILGTSTVCFVTSAALNWHSHMPDKVRYAILGWSLVTVGTYIAYNILVDIPYAYASNVSNRAKSIKEGLFMAIPFFSVICGLSRAGLGYSAYASVQAGMVGAFAGMMLGTLSSYFTIFSNSN